MTECNSSFKEFKHQFVDVVPTLAHCSLLLLSIGAYNIIFYQLQCAGRPSFVVATLGTIFAIHVRVLSVANTFWKIGTTK